MERSGKEILYGKFEIINCIKKDFHSAVYLANHTGLNKHIILKSLKTKFISDKALISRFKREAKILAQLNHPNIIKVLDFGNYEDDFYISFEYFKSKSLREYSQDNKLSDGHIKKLVNQILSGIDYAHANQVIHRDLKPENILVDENGNLKISDFGLALTKQQSLETSQYSVVGTPSYMSPEQAAGMQLTESTDFFSIGIVILELINGINPLLGKDVNDSLGKLLNYKDGDLEKDFNGVDDDIKVLLRTLLIRETNKRIEKYSEIEKEFSEIIIEKKVEKNKALYLFPAIIVLVFLFYLFTKENNGSVEKIKNEIPEIEKQNSIIDSTRAKVGELVADTTSNNVIDLPKEEISNVKNEEIIDDTLGFVPPKIEQPVLGKGFLKVNCTPWAIVFIDSQEIDVTPINEALELTEGKYILEFRNPEYPIYREEIVVKKNEVFRVEKNLETLVGYAKIEVYPWGNVRIDSVSFGQSPIFKLIKLFPGMHNFTAENPKLGMKNKQVKINAGDTITVNFKL